MSEEMSREMQMKNTWFPPLLDTELERYSDPDKEKMREIYNVLMERSTRRIYETYQNLYLQKGQEAYADDAQQIIEFNNFIEQTHQEMLEITRTQFRLEKGAETDNLTNLYRRDPFAARYEIALENLKPTEELTFAFIDLDHFKRLNEEYGHTVVDMLLAKVGEKINESIRPTDAACRHGGDEITVVLSHVGADKTKGAVQRLYEALADLCIVENPNAEKNKRFEIIDLSKKPVPPDCLLRENLSLSVGVDTIKRTDDEPYLNKVTARADMAVFVTKHKGRGGITFIEGKDADGNDLCTTFQYDKTRSAGERFTLKGSEKEKLEIERGFEEDQLYVEIVQKLDRTLNCLHGKGFSSPNLPEGVQNAIKSLAKEIHGVCYT